MHHPMPLGSGDQADSNEGIEHPLRGNSSRVIGTLGEFGVPDQARYGYGLNTVTGEKWDDRLYEPK